MLALACDYRVMNKQRGFMCINEVDIGLPLTPGMLNSGLLSSLWTRDSVKQGNIVWSFRDKSD